MKIIEVSEETYEKIKDQLTSDSIVEKLDDLIGKQFLFRTVTYFLVGRVLKNIGNGILELSGSSWVPDTGRFMNAIKNGILSEVEPVGQAFINMNTVTDFFPWNHDLPTKQK